MVQSLSGIVGNLIFLYLRPFSCQTFSHDVRSVTLLPRRELCHVISSLFLAQPFSFVYICIFVYLYKHVICLVKLVRKSVLQNFCIPFLTCVIRQCSSPSQPPPIRTNTCSFNILKEIDKQIYIKKRLRMGRYSQQENKTRKVFLNIQKQDTNNTFRIKCFQCYSQSKKQILLHDNFLNHFVMQHDSNFLKKSFPLHLISL